MNTQTMDETAWREGYLAGMKQQRAVSVRPCQIDYPVAA